MGIMKPNRRERTTQVGPANLGSRERGASEVFMLIIMTSLLAFAGLAYDAGMAFNARREATNIAASAARTGANEVSTDALYGEGLAKLDVNNAISKAHGSIPSDVEVIEISPVSDSELFVKVEITHTPVFLQLVGFDEFVMTGEASARVQAGAN